VSNLAELHGRLKPCFVRVEPFRQAKKYVAALMSDLPRKNGWTIAEQAGNTTPDRTQRLLNHAVWDQDTATAVIRGFVAEHLGDAPLRVAALDESGQERQGAATAGVARRYMGCAGRIANGVNTVYCTYATANGHALIGARVHIPADQLDDTSRRTEFGIPEEVKFRTKPQLAIDIPDDLIAEKTMPPWYAGDEVYGRAGELRTFLQDNEIGYVLRVGCAFHTELAPGIRLRADAVVATHLAHEHRWQICSVAGSKGEHRYAWA
jgi:SRSO17 transposase